MAEELKVYISSTYSDLKLYRQAVAEVIAKLGFHFIGMEEYALTTETPLKASENLIEDADLLIILIANKYGYIPTDTNVSVTEWEYNKAVELKKPIFIFILQEDYPWPTAQIDFDNLELLQKFKKRLLENRLVSFFASPDDLAIKVAMSLQQYSKKVEGISIKPKNLTEGTAEISLSSLMEELKNIHLKISSLQQVIADLQQIFSHSSPQISQSAQISSAEFLGMPASNVKQNKCFVIMPYSEKWSNAVERIILEICNEVEFEFSIAKSMEGRFIPNDIWRGITGAGVIIADLSGANPNVTYEIGLADVLGKNVIMICQGKSVPFDFLAQRMIIYEDSLTGTLTLREELSNRLKRIKTAE